MRSATKWAGWLIVIFATAHTVAALTMLGAANYADAWFTGQLWRDDLAHMSPANSALWLSLHSFGVPLLVVGLLVLWLERRGIKPPAFVAWIIGIWTLLDAVILIFTPWPIMLLATLLLLIGARGADQRETAT